MSLGKTPQNILENQKWGFLHLLEQAEYLNS